MAAPSPESAATLFQIVLRAGLIAIGLGIVLFIGAKLLDASAGNARTLAEDPTPVTVDPDGPRLDQIVLGLDDLPRGWSSQANPTAAGICDGRTPETVIVPTGSRSASFTQGEPGALIGNTVDEFASADAAKAFLDLVARVVDSCREFSRDGATTHLAPLTFPKFGDDTFAAEIAGENPDGSIRGEIIYVRVGSRVAYIASVGFTDEKVDNDLVEHLVSIVTRRMSSKPEIQGQVPSDSGDTGDGGGTLPGE